MANMVMTVLEAQVETDKTSALQEAYQEGIRQLDAGIVKTFLVQASREPSTWRILTLWENRAALDAMRASGETPRGVLMFRAAGAEPTLSVFDVVAHAGQMLPTLNE